MDDLQLLQNSKQSFLWLMKNLNELKKDLSGQVVAIKDNHIVANAPTIKRLLIEIESKGIDKNEVLIKQISSGKEIVIFYEN